MNPVHHSPLLCDTSLDLAELRGEALSCFVDGELPPSELDALLQAYDEDADARANWRAYHLIGDVLRGDSGTAVQPAEAFVSDISRRLRSEAVPHDPSRDAAVPVLRPVAANDAVFRWKLVAGVASLAAIMAVSWTLLGGAPAGDVAQLAQESGAMPPALTGPVVVQTAQGQVLRDVRLEELLAEHRQYGGMSALQMPAGFLRNATYDAAPQR